MIKDIIFRARGCLMGQLAGDSLGSLVEFKTQEEILRLYPHGVRDLADGGVWNTLAGQPTDDSEMALVLARSLVKHTAYDRDTVHAAYKDWFITNTFGCGRTVAHALRDGRLNPDSQANGALMRISPLGIFGAREGVAAETLAVWARQDAELTHIHPVCVQANILFATAVALAIRQGLAPKVLYTGMCEHARALNVEQALLETLGRAEHEPPQDYVRKQGWVLTAFGNAVWQLLHAPNLEEGVINTVMRGGDTDTNAAIAGALLGAVYGIEAIPARWRRIIESCRPTKETPGVVHHRPKYLWPVDAQELAEELVGGVGLHAVSDAELAAPALLSKAWLFAARKHQGQAYPGTELPYLVHIGAVLLELLPALRIRPDWNAELAILCALLHDTVEDTDATLEEIAEQFGNDVASGVAALTKSKHADEAMRDSLQRIREQPQEVWCVKMADRIANLGEPPVHWSREKRCAYAEEAELIMEALEGASNLLGRKLHERIQAWKRENG